MFNLEKNLEQMQSNAQPKATKQRKPKVVCDENIANILKEKLESVGFVVEKARSNSNQRITEGSKTVAYMDKNGQETPVIRMNFIPALQHEDIKPYKTYCVDGVWSACKCEIKVTLENLDLAVSALLNESVK